MPNFFQKLTGSFKMSEEDVLTEEPKNQNTAPAPQPGDNREHEPAQPDEPVEKEPFNDDGADTDLPLEDEVGLENLQENEESEEEDDPSASAVSNKGFSIAQLAKAQTATRKRQAAIKGFPRFRLHKKEEEATIPKMPEGQLAIDVYETPTDIVIKSTIAGVKPEDLDVGIEDNTVNIRGSRHNEEKIKGEDYFYQECYWGTSSRAVILPVEIDHEKVQANLKDGILTVRLPKVIKEKEKKIKVLG